MITLGNKNRKKRKPKPGVTYCPQCGRMVPDAKICVYCGNILDERLRELGGVNEP